MPWLDVVDIMYDNQIQFLVQCRVIDDDAVIDVRQFPKLAVDNAVKRVLVAKELYWEYVKKSLWSDLRPRDGNTVHTAVMTARLLHKQGRYAESASYYEALLKYFLKDKYK